MSTISEYHAAAIAAAHTVVLHHDDADGFASALSAYLALPAHGVAFIAVNYHYPETLALYKGDALAGKRVFILDFSAPGGKDEAEAHMKHLDQITGHQLRVIDHHKVCEPLAEKFSFVRYVHGKAGCILAWDYFEQMASPDNESRNYRAFDAEIPPLIERIGAYDIWAHRKEGADPQFSAECEAVNLGLENDALCEPDQWERWAALIANKHGEYNELLATGATLVSFRDKLVRDICKPSNVQMREFASGLESPVVFSPVFPNEVACQLLEDYPDAPFVGVAKHVTTGGKRMIKCSLRSGGRYDCSAVAHIYGGNGHAAASGFAVEEGKFPI